MSLYVITFTRRQAPSKEEGSVLIVCCRQK